jgi:glycosyltransferase involved in cell wall biosynthesis
MADILKKHKFSVSLIDYNSERRINYHHYDLIIGFGPSFVRSFSDSEFKGKRILYLTGANSNYTNAIEAKRIKEANLKNNSNILPRREAYWPWMYSAINASSIMLIGNSWTKNTYKEIPNSIYTLPVPYLKNLQAASNLRSIEKAKKNYCWFGSTGAIHKGLDIAIEAFELIGEDFTLSIYGSVGLEVDFMLAYGERINRAKNISLHGFIEVSSESMKKVASENMFVIFPSCSEGTSSSVITCMTAGLIPIITKECGIDLAEENTLEIQTLSVESIIHSVHKSSKLSVKELELMSLNAIKYATTRHSIHAFKESFEVFLFKSLITECRI